jgi:hypothetical protein
MTKEDLNDFFNSEPWDRLVEILGERKESAIYQLRNADRDADRDLFRGQLNEIDFVLSIKEVFEQDVKEPTND